MTEVKLRASGYTWSCPECSRENYTGAAPTRVACAGCHAEFPVHELTHRLAADRPQQTTLFERVNSRSDGREP